MHVIDENGPSTLCVPSDRSMKPALSSGLAPGEGCAEICGTEEHMEENREGCRVDESVCEWPSRRETYLARRTWARPWEGRVSRGLWQERRGTRLAT